MVTTSAGESSRTLLIVLIAFAMITLRYLVGMSPWLDELALSSYIGGVAGLVGLYQGREFRADWAKKMLAALKAKLIVWGSIAVGVLLFVMEFVRRGRKAEREERRADLAEATVEHSQKLSTDLDELSERHEKQREEDTGSSGLDNHW